MGLVLWLLLSFVGMLLSLALFGGLPGIGIGIFIAGTILLQGLRRIPADPPTLGIKTRFGKRTGGKAMEGWNFFLFYPFVTGYIRYK